MCNSYAVLKSGDRVRVADTPIARRWIGSGAGVVTGYSRPLRFGSVLVRRDGESLARGYAPWFWVRESDGATGKAVDR